MIKKIAVVGRGLDAWLTALFLKKMICNSETKIKIQLVELPSELIEKDIVSALPSLRTLHELIGINEVNLLKACGGSILLGQRYSNWSSPGREFMQVFDTAGVSLHGVDFFQYWVKARKNGLQVSLDDFSLGGICAKSGRIAQKNNAKPLFENFSYGYNLPAIKYLKIIAKIAITSGIEHLEDEVTGVAISNGCIESVKLSSGRLIKADLFIDASGAKGELIGQFKEGEIESWSDQFPCDSLLISDGSKLSPVPMFNQVTAFSAGWLSVHPADTKTTFKLNFDEKLVNVNELPDLVSSVFGIKIKDFHVSKRQHGIRSKFWIGNCISVGEASCVLDNIEYPQTHALFFSLTQLVTLFPVDRNWAYESEIYNDKLKNNLESIRDFQLAHYYLSNRKENFWRRCKEKKIPDKLNERLSAYNDRGFIPVYENEMFQEDSWRYLLSGMELMPKSYNPLVDRISDIDQIQWFQKILKFLAEEAKYLPDLKEYMNY